MFHRLLIRAVAHYFGPHMAYSELATASVNAVIAEELMEGMRMA